MSGEFSAHDKQCVCGGQTDNSATSNTDALLSVLLPLLSPEAKVQLRDRLNSSAETNSVSTEDTSHSNSWDSSTNEECIPNSFVTPECELQPTWLLRYYGPNMKPGYGFFSPGLLLENTIDETFKTWYSEKLETAEWKEFCKVISQLAKTLATKLEEWFMSKHCPKENRPWSDPLNRHHLAGAVEVMFPLLSTKYQDFVYRYFVNNEKFTANMGPSSLRPRTFCEFLFSKITQQLDTQKKNSNTSDELILRRPAHSAAMKISNVLKKRRISKQSSTVDHAYVSPR